MSDCVLTSPFRWQVTQKSLFARITHPTEGPAYVEFTDDPEPYRSSGTVDVLGVQTLKMQEMASVLARMEQSLSLHEAWLKEVSRRAKPEEYGWTVAELSV